MTMRALFQAANEFTGLLNQVSASSRTLTQQQMQRVRDLTNDEVWWTRAQAVFTGAGAAVSGACTLTTAGLPSRGQIAEMPWKTVKMIVKTFGSASNTFGDISSTFARGEAMRRQSERSLAERCDISRLQQDEGNRSSSYSQMIQAVQGIMSAKARL